MTTILLLALLGAVLSAVVGTIWYSPSTPMGKIHMRYLGFDVLSPEEQKQKMEEAKPKMPKIYGAQMVLSFMTSFLVVSIVTMAMQNGMSFTTTVGFILINWLCFIVPTVGGAILWGTCDERIAWKKFFSDIGVSFVTLILIAYVASLFV